MRCALMLCALPAFPAAAQNSDDLQKIVERLDRLEEQNRALTAEIHALREQLAAARSPAPAAAPSTEERLEVQESRTTELATSKVEASQKLPIRITGMVLFNSFLNSRGSGGAEYPVTASDNPLRSGGATLRQTLLGLDYDGPRIFGGGKVTGSVRMDFWGGDGTALDQAFRLRTGTINIDWKDRSFRVGVDKPIISPRDPESIAQVAVSPLTATGNLWFWIPQARFEQDFHFTHQTGVKAQVAVVQTHEVRASSYSPYQPGASSSTTQNVEPARPGFEGRVELFGGTARRFEIASGMHHSTTHTLGQSLASDVVTLDWYTHPLEPLEFTGTVFNGHNVSPLGSIPQGFVALGPGRVTTVQSRGGWGQLTYRPLPRLWFNFFTGQQDDRNSDLPVGGIGKNLAYGANFFYRLAPNILASVEVSQIRTSRIGSGTLMNNHYDLALAYQF